MKALEDGKKYDATQSAIRKREEAFLVTLRAMKESMLQEQEEGKNTGNCSVVADVAALTQENDRLQAKTIKQEYRIAHLVTNMEQLLLERNVSKLKIDA